MIHYNTASASNFADTSGSLTKQSVHCMKKEAPDNPNSQEYRVELLTAAIVPPSPTTARGQNPGKTTFASLKNLCSRCPGAKVQLTTVAGQQYHAEITTTGACEDGVIQTAKVR